MKLNTRQFWKKTRQRLWKKFRGFASRRRSGRKAGYSDLNEMSQAQVDAARLLWDLHVADGDVGHDRQRQGLERLMKAVREALGPRHLDKQVYWQGT